MSSTTTFKTPTPVQIESWKKQHGEIRQLNVNDATCIVRMPKLEDVDMAQTIGKDDEVKTGLIQLRNCWLAGDEKILNDLDYTLNASRIMGRLFPVLECTLEDVKLVTALKKQVPEDKIQKVEEDGIIRKMSVKVKVLKRDLKGNPIEWDEAVGYFRKPDMEIRDKAIDASTFIQEGKVYVDECWLFGDERLRTGADEIRFQAYTHGHFLIKRHTVEVVKL